MLKKEMLLAMTRLASALWYLPLLRLLREIKANDQNYDKRYGLVLQAVSLAHQLGMKAGFGFDPQEPDWPVAYIELPTGQVSWHLPAHPAAFDGHTTATKYERIRQLGEFAFLDAPVTPAPLPALHYTGLSRIVVNIWDDYCDDGHVPAGKVQHTEVYIESGKELSNEQVAFENLALRFLYFRLRTLPSMEHVVIDYKPALLAVTGTPKEWPVLVLCPLPHSLREQLLRELRALKLEFEGLSFHFISES